MYLYKLFEQKMTSKVKNQLDEFEQNDYQLIAIHTSLEDYRLAYCINQQLPINLAKCDSELQVIVKQGETHFARFQFKDQDTSSIWDLIDNKNLIDTEKSQDVSDLFSGTFNNFSEPTYLLPEYKKVKFFLKIETEDSEIKIAEVVAKIKTIEKITMVYAVDKDKIKSKNNLIF